MTYFEFHFITFFGVERIDDTIEKLRSISDASKEAVPETLQPQQINES